MREILRQEQKYMCTVDQYMRLKSVLSLSLKEDTNNSENGYVVRTLYFDTIFDSDFYNKADGIEIRKKMRLRIYHPDNQYAYLEMKQKHGVYQRKRSLKVTRHDAKELCKGNYSVLLNYEEEFAKECYVVLNEEMYSPKVIVEYDRYAYVLDCNSTRITFDSKIRSTSSSFDIFDSNLVLDDYFEQSAVVLEVKFDNFLMSYIKDLIRLENPSLLSVSKYYLSRQNIIL